MGGRSRRHGNADAWVRSGIGAWLSYVKNRVKATTNGAVDETSRGG